jgi:hypothetical protein
VKPLSRLQVTAVLGLNENLFDQRAFKNGLPLAWAAVPATAGQYLPIDLMCIKTGDELATMVGSQMPPRWCTRISATSPRQSHEATSADTLECRDVSEDIAGELLDRAFDADENLSEDTKRFIDRHVTPGEKRPPAPSLRRGDDHALRVGGRKTSARGEKKPRCCRGF